MNCKLKYCSVVANYAEVGFIAEATAPEISGSSGSETAQGKGPTIIGKATYKYIDTKSVTMEGYSTITLRRGNWPTENVLSVRSLQVESTNIKSPLGNLSIGADDSWTFGNDFVSTGMDASGRIIFDYSLPTSSSSSIGTTLYFHPNSVSSTLESINSSIYEGFQRYNATPYPVLSPLILAP